MKILKEYVRNHYRPEACIIESYVAEEIVEYCTEYLHDVNLIGIPVSHNLPDNFGRGLTISKPQIVDLNLLNQAHLYVLCNTAIIDLYIEKHIEQLRIENPSHSRDKVWIQNKYIKEFIKWFENHIYYGVIEEIWKLDYIDFRLPIFKCTWVNSNGGSKIDENGFILVNFNRIGHKDDCFILANKAKQVFFVLDPSNSQWLVVLTCNPRFLMEEHDNDITLQKMFVCTRSIYKIVYDNFDDIFIYYIEDGGEIELNITRKVEIRRERRKLKNNFS
ncbi:hypothetical protein AXF42_Ash006896 [Apostasia shenzhenica]|uniref:DUF4218 domain-containing protein n=1 Tax=Apostasia shenzhenica TaxID=1088818 RepID=A0A2I0BEI2_9ASPA|nr:hypothetical protein AXF42_Ash006896 [Apostasia shenzhenica]